MNNITQKLFNLFNNHIKLALFIVVSFQLTIIGAILLFTNPNFQFGNWQLLISVICLVFIVSKMIKFMQSFNDLEYKVDNLNLRVLELEKKRNIQ